MHAWITTIGVTLLTLACAAGAWFAVLGLLRPEGAERNQVRARVSAWIVALFSGLIYGHRWLLVRGDWQPLESHLDGLLLIVSLFSFAVLYLDRRTSLPGIYAFAMPVNVLLLAWAICASSWTLELFAIGRLLLVFHIFCVYFGSIFLILAAVAGGMYLFVRKQLKSKRNLKLLHRLPSLELLESVIVRASGFGFAMLTVGLVTGLVVVSQTPGKLGPGWWYSPKVMLAFGAWLVYGLVINVRYTTVFRGSRAAWLSIFGALLLLSTFGAVTAMRGPAPEPAQTTGAQVTGGLGGEHESVDEGPGEGIAPTGAATGEQGGDNGAAGQSGSGVP